MQALFLFTICCCVWPSFEKLAGDHICQMQISEPVETLVWTIKNRTLRTFQWCLNVPPRCSSYSNVQVNETQTLVNYVNKTVERCCDGYYEREGECADEACKGCRNGYCSNGYCDCKPGWMGSSCDRPCMTDQRGSNCTNQCNCWKYIQCVAENKAECDCVSGWLPDSCELTCPKPYYGTKCVHLCTCNILTQTCTIEKGKCVIKEKKSKDVIDYQGENAESTTVTDDSADVRTTLTSRSPFQITVLFTNQSGSTNNLSNTDHFLVTHQPQKEISSRNLFLGIASLSVITVVVTATVIGLLALKLIRRKADKGCPDKNATAVAVYTTSIFHTPLPDPPLFENPSYYSVKENNVIEQQEIRLRDFNPLYQNKENAKQANLENLTWHPDIPRSISVTGTLPRGTSEDVSHQLFVEELEPVYDEIPSRDPPKLCHLHSQNSTSNHSSTYMNAAVILKNSR
ncbi:multiple epidermal growth factor-like domains protein 10 [Cylas formicarius]|uniref:multiple epidermal growth factor-like domains protein 10 n=1 Tax=Cylas formicarius TaxID=197179 RepID=UPI0029584A3C|nr:multiple epidermal growth factor-like domains protein 10 [Cylas formicarius]XP_060524581.1 multiple epidermal growth factor-like domains protein 10 [Cylas formicarius]